MACIDNTSDNYIFFGQMESWIIKQRVEEIYIFLARRWYEMKKSVEHEKLWIYVVHLPWEKKTEGGNIFSETNKISLLI